MSTTRTVKHALFEYIDAAGTRRVALRGDQVDLSDEDLARGERFGAFLAQGESLLEHVIVAAPLAPDATTVSTGLVDPSSAAASGELTEDATVEPGHVQRPAQVAAKPLWVDYAVSRGMDREVAEAMSKQQIIDTYPTG